MTLSVTSSTVTSAPAEVKNDCALFNFVVWGVCGGILCIFGYIGNCLSVIALQRDVRSATTTLLQTLAISDLILLVSVAVTDAAPYICDYTDRCNNPWRSWPQVRYFWFLTPISHMCSIWLVVLVAANRYWAVCRPHTVAAVWTSRRTLIYVVTAVVLVLIFNIPRMFEYTIEFGKPVATNNSDTGVTIATALLNWTSATDKSVYGAGGNNSLPVGANNYSDVLRVPPAAASVEYSLFVTPQNNVSMPHNNGSMTAREEVTPFGKRYSYRIVYKVLFVNILLVLLPVATLIVLSAFIVRALRRTPSYRLAQVSKQRHSANGSSAVCVSPKQLRHTDFAAVENVAAADVTIRQQSVDGANVDQQQPLGRLQYVKRQSRATVRRIKNTLTRDDRRGSRVGGVSSSLASREITFVLITVVLVAVVCQSPLLVFHCVRYLAPTNRCGHVIFYLETAAKLLVNINSCANFVIYCLLSPKFRRRLNEAVTCKAKQRYGSTYSHGQVSHVMINGPAIGLSNVLSLRPTGNAVAAAAAAALAAAEEEEATAAAAAAEAAAAAAAVVVEGNNDQHR